MNICIIDPTSEMSDSTPAIRNAVVPLPREESVSSAIQIEDDLQDEISMHNVELAQDGKQISLIICYFIIIVIDHIL